ncbi:MAG: YidB family protein [Bacteroidales bacterium]
MSLLDQLKGPLANEVLKLIKYHEGGLPGLVNQLKNSGLGDQVTSWIGLGENKKVDASQIIEVLGNDKIKGIAQKLGVSEEAAAQSVAGTLPEVVDNLTPNGKIENDSFIEKGMDALRNLFK